MKSINRPVEEANVGGVDFVLVLNGGYEAGDWGGDQVQGGVHLLRLLHKVSIEENFRKFGWFLYNLGFPLRIKLNMCEADK